MIGILIGMMAASTAICVWIVSASYLYCRLSHHIDLFVYPWDQWLEIASNWTATGWTKAFVMASAVGATAPFVGLGILWSRKIGKHLVRPLGGGLRPVENGVTENLGKARWARPDELHVAFKRDSGCLIGASDPGSNPTFWMDDLKKGPMHSMSFAGPGGFKSTTTVTRISKYSGPCVVFDPSCEIGPIMTEGLERSGRKVRTIGIRDGGLNVLDWIDTSDQEADAHIRTAVELIYDENSTKVGAAGQSKDPFWSMWGRALITCLMAHMLYDKRQDFPVTLEALRQGITTPEDVMQNNLLPVIHANSNSSMAREIAGGLMGIRAPATFTGIYSNAFGGTDWLSVAPYAKMVSGSSMKTSDILNGEDVVFIQTPLRSLLSTPAIGRTVLGSLFNAMYHADGKGIDNPILFEIDEAWTLGKLSEIKLGYTTARKYSGIVRTIWQSEGQMENVWGKDDAKTLRDSASWRSYGAIQDGDVAEKLSRDLGERPVMAISEGTNRGSSAQQFSLWGSRNSGSTTNRHEIKRRLIKADEITRSPADKQFVLFRDFPYPIECWAAPYFRYPDIARQMSVNRFVRQTAE